MSWAKENYEKAALGGAAAILLGVVGVSVFGGGDALTAKAKKFTQDDTTEVESHSTLAATVQARSVEVEIPEKTEGLRKVDLFVGQALYIKEGETKVVDPHESDVVMHEGIPNVFWLKNGIDPTFANAADRDFDKDGFSNREEYNADTNPADKAEHPSPLKKLVGRDVDVFKMQMRWSEFDAGSISLTYQDNKRVRLRGQRVPLGAKFFVDAPESVNQRFVLGDKVEVTGEDGRTQVAYEVEDTLPLYKGTDRAKFVLLKRGSKSGGFNEIQDRSVKLSLNALGQEAEVFTVAEGQTFSLPYDPAAAVQPYKVEGIVAKPGSAGSYLVTISETIDGETTKDTISVSKR